MQLVHFVYFNKMIGLVEAWAITLQLSKGQRLQSRDSVWEEEGFFNIHHLLLYVLSYLTALTLYLFRFRATLISFFFNYYYYHWCAVPPYINGSQPGNPHYC